MRIVGFVVLIAILSKWCVSHGQELVPNPSFECGVDLCGPYISGDFSLYACDWGPPTGGTTDVYSNKLENRTCSSAMPYTGTYWSSERQGSQSPRTGERFIGIFTTYRDSYREYAQAKLLTPLVQGRTYCAEMYVSAGESGQFASNNIGLHLSEERIMNGGIGPLHIDPQINADNVINDTENWLRIAGEITARAPYEYITIGNFYDNDQTSVVFKGPSNDNYYAYSYYFIDDVSVQAKPNNTFQFDFPDRICEGDFISIKSDVGTEKIIWTSVDDTVTVLNRGPQFALKLSKSQKFRLKAVGCNRTVIDTLELQILPKIKIDLGADKTICQGTYAEFSSPLDPSATYLWNEAQGTNTAVFDKEGLYILDIESISACYISDTVRLFIVNGPPISTMPQDTVFCNSFLDLFMHPESASILCTGQPDRLAKQ